MEKDSGGMSQTQGAGAPTQAPAEPMEITAPVEQASPSPGLWRLFLTLSLIGIQSFGGGSSTFLLIHQACMRHKWMSEEEFIRDWALAQIAPGINLIKLTMMLGYRLRGWGGLAAASAGLILPSGMITLLMTAGFTAINSAPLVKAALRGVMPAAIGLSLAMAVQMAHPSLALAYKEGRPRLAAHLVILAAAALGRAILGLSPALVLLLSGALATLALALLPAHNIFPTTEEK
jgi:chromate transporter